MLIGAEVLREMRQIIVAKEFDEEQLHEMLLDNDCLKLDRALCMGDLEYALLIIDKMVPNIYTEKDLNKITSLIKEKYQ